MCRNVLCQLCIVNHPPAWKFQLIVLLAIGFRGRRCRYRICLCCLQWIRNSLKNSSITTGVVYCFVVPSSFWDAPSSRQHERWRWNRHRRRAGWRQPLSVRNGRFFWPLIEPNVDYSPRCYSNYGRLLTQLPEMAAKPFIAWCGWPLTKIIAQI